MDHVSLLAMHDQLLDQVSEDAAQELTLNAIGAQGDEKSIKTTVAQLRGENPNRAAADGGLADFNKLLGQ